MGAELQSLQSIAGEALIGTCVAYEVERQVRLTDGMVEVGKFRWPAPIDLELRSKEDSIAFNLALSPRPANARLVRLSGSSPAHQDRLDRVMLLNPGSTYRLNISPGKVRSLSCEIDRSAVEQLVGPVDWDGENWQLRSRSRMPVIELLLNRMYEELREKHLASELALDAYARALCVELARCLHPGDGSKGTSKGGLAPWRLRLLRQRICADAPAPRLPELAELCGLTVRQLSRAFKEETGKTLGSFIVEATMERAVHLLTQTDRPIAEIAAELGFATPTSFTYSFRRAIGALPRELRRRASEG